MNIIQRNGDLRLYVSDGQYVMDGGTTGRHSLCVDVSSLERVQAHWRGFQESNVELGGCGTDVVLPVENLSQALVCSLISGEAPRSTDYHFEITIMKDSWGHADQELRDQFLTNYGKVKKADVHKLYDREFFDPNCEVYEFWIEGKRVSWQEFREEVDKVSEANRLARAEKLTKPTPARELTPFQKIKESVRSEREEARLEAQSCWPFVMSRGVEFFAQHRTNHNLDIEARGHSSHDPVNVTKKELLENIKWVCDEHKDIDPSEFEFCLAGGFDGNDRLKDFHYDYEPWVSEWDTFKFDYQLNEIGGSSNV
jgi:hypothetical protein